MKADTKILVIDDDSIAGFIIRKNFENAGIKNITVCENGKDGMEAFREQDFDLAIVDLNLGSESGIELALRMTQEKQGFPIIFLSASVDPVQIEAAKKIPNSVYFDRFAPVSEIIIYIDSVINKS